MLSMNDLQNKREELKSSRPQKRTLTFAKGIPVFVPSLVQLSCYHPSSVCRRKKCQDICICTQFQLPGH